MRRSRKVLKKNNITNLKTENVLLYWMYAIRFNASTTMCLAKRKEKKKKEKKERKKKEKKMYEALARWSKLIADWLISYLFVF